MLQGDNMIVIPVNYWVHYVSGIALPVLRSPGTYFPHDERTHPSTLAFPHLDDLGFSGDTLHRM